MIIMDEKKENLMDNLTSTTAQFGEVESGELEGPHPTARRLSPGKSWRGLPYARKGQETGFMISPYLAWLNRHSRNSSERRIFTESLKPFCSNFLLSNLESNHRDFTTIQRQLSHKLFQDRLQKVNGSHRFIVGLFSSEFCAEIRRR